ncbi:LuxR C-terminal-related transcriptional regulator [Frankia sp. Cpl3]|nr:LuxR C-terminal-related transcriptional regulator [Parafrankia colletiae]MCK9903313.1 LuxR C-terminal-related transcriptional regulator [Frankia sp. Cpl3]
MPDSPGRPELAVGRRAAAGLASRQGAREVVLSEKTVDHHLRTVFGKLAVTARAQQSGRIVASIGSVTRRDGADRVLLRSN